MMLVHGRHHQLISLHVHTVHTGWGLSSIAAESHHTWRERFYKLQMLEGQKLEKSVSSGGGPYSRRGRRGGTRLRGPREHDVAGVKHACVQDQAPPRVRCLVHGADGFDEEGKGRGE